jgi:RHS repeat-associated protein
MDVDGGDYTSWAYDERGRVITEGKQIPGGGQFFTEFTYNSADLPKTMTYPVDNEVVTFTYNNNMLPTSVSGTNTYAQSIAYDAANRMTEILRGVNKVHTDYTYNPWNADGGRLQNLTSTQVSPANNLQNLTYDYDSVGNINTIIDSLSGPQTQTFTYDVLDRVLTSSATGGSNGLYSESYTYNGTTGNLSSKGGVNYTAYDANHKHAVTNLSNGNSYAYDANGNMTSRNVGGQSFTLAYDTENRLVSVTGAATASFSYDADGKQVIGTVNGVTTYYVGQHYEKKSGVVTKYYFAGTMRLAVRTSGTLSFLLGDHLGSSSVTTDANGGYSAQELYKAFGETRYSYGTLGTDYHFTGQREEASLGIYYFNARWMDPSLGRFTSPDTIIPTQTQGTQAWDRYAFVNNNPVRYTDPTGHRCVAEDGEDEDCLNNDGSKGAGFTGIASSSSGASSNVEKSCGGWGEKTCGGSTNNYYLPGTQRTSDAFMWGFNLSGSSPGLYLTGGMEELYFLDDKTRATYAYEGEGEAIGAGGSVTVYLGEVWNIENPEDYNGPFGAVGLTFSTPVGGLSVSYFWDTAHTPLSSGTTQGYSIGFSPGAQLSGWWSSTFYKMLEEIH